MNYDPNDNVIIDAINFVSEEKYIVIDALLTNCSLEKKKRILHTHIF